MTIFSEGLLSRLVNNNLINQDGAVYIAVFIGFVVLSITVSYLLGSISSAIIVSKLLYKEDVRSHGSGNAGLTNMLRTYGAKAAVLTLVGDMLKTALAILFTAFLFGFSYEKGISLSGYCYLSGMWVVLGHVYPIFYGFKGGKGVLVTATMALILTPVSFGALILTFAAILAISRYVSLGSITVATLYPITVCLYCLLLCNTLPIMTAICTIFLGAFIVWCHRANIKRLASGTEKKLSIGKKEKNN